MESEKGNRSRSGKRKPLSDRTNLISTTTTKLSIPIPIPISTTPKQSSISKTVSTIPSSNNNKYAPNPPSTPPNPSNGNGERSEPLVVYSRFHSREKTKIEATAVAVPFYLLPQEKLKEKGKAISVEKRNEKGKAVAVPLSYLPVEKTKDKGKAIAVPFNFLRSEKTKDKEKAVTITPSFPSLAETKDNGRENAKDRGNRVAVAFSCPPPLRTKNIWNGLDKDGDTRISMSHTSSHLKHKKKRSKYALPQDFIEQQRAYFKEIDDFELQEEEISNDELVKEE